MRGCATVLGKFFEVMSNPAPPLKPTSNSVAGDTFTPLLLKKVLGAALGAVVTGLVLAPSPAQALTACASVTTTLTAAQSCTIDDGGTTYSISLQTGTFPNAFPSPSTTTMFWWGDAIKAGSAASAVGGAFGFPNPIYSNPTGPLFAYAIHGPPPISIISRGIWTYGGMGYNIELATSPSTTQTWATSYSQPAPAGPAASVPGPLPVLGVAAAFGFSRKLRKRTKRSTNSAAGTLGA